MTTVQSDTKPKKRKGAPKEYLFTKENGPDKGRIGGLKSGEVRRENAKIRDLVKIILQRPGKEEKTQMLEVAVAAVRMAKESPKGLENLLAMVGEQIVQKVEDVNETKLTDALIASRQRGSNDD